ncbi:MFS transporter [Streptomyces sp. NPDC088725]|uniref:MFS transporter n=1 Tax=Streptomyces sp. NPDC088725 TaxID=3365873 RepID=UPI0038229D18
MPSRHSHPGSTPAEDTAVPQPVGEGDESSVAAIHRWRLLAVLLAAQFMANIDTAIVNIAGPAVQSSLGASGGQVGLVISGYVVAYAVLLVARILQGAGAALMVPQVLSGIQLHFTGQQRIKALGYYAVALSGGAVAGQALGGLLIAADLFGTSWRPIFLINVPAGMLLVWAALRSMPGDENEKKADRQQEVDLCGMLFLSMAVLLLIVPLLLGTDEGWPAWTWGCLAASVPMALVFRRSQRRRSALGGRPLIAEEVVREPAVRWSLVAHGITTMTYFALLFVLAVYLQEGLGRGPAYAGVAMVSWVAAFGLAGPLLARVPERYRAAMPALGCVALAVGYTAVWVYLATGHRTGPALFVLLGIGGLGLGVSSNSLIGQMTFALPDRYAADLSGVISTNAQLCGALGVAALGGGYLLLADGGTVESAANGMEAVLGASAVLSVLSAVAAQQGSRSRATTGTPVVLP